MRDRVRVLLTTEGTYPHVVGGVSTWCDQLLRHLPEFAWQVYAITAGGRRQIPAYRLPDHARLVTAFDLWGSVRRPVWAGGGRAGRDDLAAGLAGALFGWDVSPDRLVDELTWCADHPDRVEAAFRGRVAWRLYLAQLEAIQGEVSPEVAEGWAFDLASAVQGYQALGWIARLAATPVEPVDVVHASAAGWAAIPGIVQRARRGTPMLLTEHGVYVREAYLAATRSENGMGHRALTTRMARGLARAAYRSADWIAPVTDAHRSWETHLGAAPGRIHTIPNGVVADDAVEPPPGRRTVVSVGRIDPLKDVATMLRVAAAVVRRLPDASFRHYGPVPAGQDGYMAACRRLHAELGLGDAFRFMGPTTTPMTVTRAADVALMTSISEGFPMAVLEALAVGRPVVATEVGGVRDALVGAGLTAPPRDVQGLAEATATLLSEHELAAELGARGHARVQRRFSQDAMLAAYRAVLNGLGRARPLAASA